MLSILVIVLGILYLVICGVKQHDKNSKKRNAVSSAQLDLNVAERECENAKQAMLQAVSKAFGVDRAAQVANSTVWSGMPYYLIYPTIGSPGDVKESFYKGVKTERWYYNSYTTRLGTIKYKLELTLEDDVLVGWKDIS